MAEDADFIVVGSGAGGGPLAANLARRGFKVLLLEAGDDLCSTKIGEFLYKVPIFHGLCTEHPACSWDFFVHHYADPQREQRDSKFDPAGSGVWYPRAGTLGGCTAHNAMITVTPQAIDWDTIAYLTGDWSWRAENMYKYFAGLERCGYVSAPGSLLYLIKGLLWSARAVLTRRNWRDWRHGHGFSGWLSTGQASPALVFRDWALVKLLVNTFKIVVRLRIGSLFARSITNFDPNDLRNSEDSPEGLALTPLATAKGSRNGPRDYLVETAEKYPQNLRIALNTLATRIVFDGKRAVGVEVLRGKSLYQASAEKSPAPGTTHQYTARHEVIVAAGAFNSPQLLKLSGVGPKAELDRFGIPVVADLPGVGANLQDRYEVAVVNELPQPFALLEGATFKPPGDGDASLDPLIERWKNGRGLYCSNGSLIGIMKRSSAELPEPDLYIFGVPGSFRGYKRGYSAEFERFRNRFTWLILKAYTNNRGGRVVLESRDPTKPPRIDFHYFEEGTDENGNDLRAVVEGVKFVRRMNNQLGKRMSREEVPGAQVASDAELAQFIRDEAWGHHASCTNKIGAKADPMSVLDSEFRVRGTERLRVVDASVFPKIPGYFIVSAVYMISEKASDVIAREYSAA